MIVICLCIHEKSPRETAVINSRASWIFKALLRIKKSFKSIDFDLVKHISVFNVKRGLNLFEKRQFLKLR